MTRHLLALFALFSGIAALHTPAQASAWQSSVQNSRSVASEAAREAGDTCECPEARKRGDKCPRPEPKKAWSWLPNWLRPSVILGGDRSLE